MLRHRHTLLAVALVLWSGAAHATDFWHTRLGTSQASGTATRFMEIFMGSGIASTDRPNLTAGAGTVVGIACALDGTPGAGTSYTFNVRRNAGASTSAGDVECTIADAATTCSDTGNFLLSGEDGISIGVIPANTPSARRVACALAVETW